MESVTPQRCSGTKVLTASLTPWIDPQDPAFAYHEWPCPGCPDCLAGATLTDLAEVEAIERFPGVMLEISDAGIEVPPAEILATMAA